jgi:hypothetical protein
MAIYGAADVVVCKIKMTPLLNDSFDPSFAPKILTDILYSSYHFYATFCIILPLDHDIVTLATTAYPVPQISAT